MGTRSTIHFFENKTHIVSIYQQYNGYPSHVGLNLANFLLSGKIVNGYSSEDAKNYNGMGCLTAQFIAKFKDGIGNFYITNKKNLQEFNYIVTFKDNENLVIQVIDEDGNRIFKGNCEEFLSFCQSN